MNFESMCIKELESSIKLHIKYIEDNNKIKSLIRNKDYNINMLSIDLENKMLIERCIKLKRRLDYLKGIENCGKRKITI